MPACPTASPGASACSRYGEEQASGRFAEAEAVYRKDLKRNPGNGWWILGLREALAAQDRAAEAMEVGSRLAAAWPRTDVKAPDQRRRMTPARTRASVGPEGRTERWKGTPISGGG